MKAPDDGGPAFPHPGYTIEQPSQRIIAWAGGMCLRDWFAAMALQGILAGRINELRHIKENQEPLYTNEGMAGWAYRFADAMLKARGEAAHE